MESKKVMKQVKKVYVIKSFGKLTLYLIRDFALWIKILAGKMILRATFRFTFKGGTDGLG